MSPSPRDKEWKNSKRITFPAGRIAPGEDRDAAVANGCEHKTAARGTITFYELPVSSLMSVPGAGVEPAGAEGPRDFKDTGEGKRTKDLSNTLPFSRPRSTSRGSTVRGLWTPIWTPVRCRRLAVLSGVGARRPARPLCFYGQVHC
jgi:hypothetical protein